VAPQGVECFVAGGRQRDWHHPRAGFFLRHHPQERFGAQKINFCEHWAHSNNTIAHYGSQLSTEFVTILERRPLARVRGQQALEWGQQCAGKVGVWEGAIAKNVVMCLHRNAR
jgi:hypothetical protein